MKSKVLIYPFDLHYKVIIDYSDMLQDLEVAALVSPKGWGMKEESFQCEDKELIIKNDFEIELAKCDVVWFCNSELPLDFEKFFVDKIIAAVSAGKKILFTKKVSASEEMILKKILPIEFRYTLKEEFADELSAKRLYAIKTPVIAVCSLYNGVGQFDVELALRSQFIKRKINFLQVGSENYSEIFGMNSIPDFIFQNEMSEVQKIVKFNHFLKQKELEDDFDVIVLGVPGEMLGVKENIFEELGVYAFEILRTLSVDCSVLCMPYEEQIIEKRRTIAEGIEKTYGIPIDYFNIAPSKLDIERSEEMKKVSYVKLDLEFVLKRIIDEDVFCIVEEREKNRLADKIIEQLSSYSIEV